MTEPTLPRAARVFGRALRDRPFQRVLDSLGVGEDPVRVTLATTTLGEFAGAFPDLASSPVIVIDEGKGRIARLDFHSGGAGEAIQVDSSTEMGMLVDCIQSLHRDIAAELLQASVHAQTREFDFA